MKCRVEADLFSRGPRGARWTRRPVVTLRQRETESVSVVGQQMIDVEESH